MNKFIKNFDTFVKENLDPIEQIENSPVEDEMVGAPKELPQEVINSVKSIVDGNFDQAWRKRFDGDTIRFRVTDTDFKLEPEETLEMDLVQGASKKRKYDVILHFVDKVEASPKDQDAGIGGDLIYSIEYMPKTSSGKSIKSSEEEEPEDNYYKVQDEPELPESPEEELGLGKRRRKGSKKIELDDIDSAFRGNDYEED